MADEQQKRDAGQLQSVFRAMLTPPFKFLWNVTTEGMDNVPASGGAIIAPNHISVLDSFFVPLVLPRRITYVGKAEYMDDWKTKWLFPAMGMIPIDRSGGDAAKAALDAAAGCLEAGELFGIYPEGTRARDGLLHKGHTGVARLALRTGVPIVPVGIIGSDEVQPPDSRYPQPFRRVHIRFGRPIDVERYMDRASDRLVLRQIVDEVMYEIRNLSGQTYVDTYATKPAKAPVVPTVVPTVPEEEVEHDDRPVAPVIPIDRPSRPAEPAAPAASEPAASEAVAGNGGPATPAVVVASAAAGPTDLSIESDGVERRSSAAVLRSRPLDLDLALTGA
ncbi:lysophospholipid acyltransferase family protein [Dermatobacter hominis]|uniref:lysophospholipid acyltransferase family protein n=1 Tax=Dermatobacter hominis TaxID=2884263 RepID=UPI001D11E59C|nr:lysophospholipid acyltransferase family protein [Dermatobacter hominis]UDY36140.1 1-acyl-sn-glycerol-3-phosphate acyltransferase [Dermatobacter hominis]